MDTVTKKLGMKIKNYRKAKGLTQEDLAFQSKIDYSYLNEIEAGKRNPSVKRVAKIATVLGVKIKDLFE